MDIMKQLKEIGIIPVVALDDVEDALPLAEALIKGGLPAAEITFRTDAAEESIRRVAEAFPEMAVGAGTVLTVDQADAAIAAGAKFIVSPGLNPKVTGHVLERGMAMLPGVVTPSEIEQALEFGLSVVKFFPAESYGGLNTIKALAAPYHMLSFMPTGGLTPANARDYLADSHIYACGGTWMVKKNLIAEKRFDEICRLAAEAAAIVKEVRG